MSDDKRMEEIRNKWNEIKDFTVIKLSSGKSVMLDKDGYIAISYINKYYQLIKTLTEAKNDIIYLLRKLDKGDEQE